MHAFFFHRLTSAMEDYSDPLEPTAKELDEFVCRHIRTHKFISSTELLSALRAGEKPDPRWIHLSMDDGFASSVNAAKICAKRGAKVTVFVTSDVIRGFNPWFNRRVAAIIQARKRVTYAGRTIDTNDPVSASHLHNAIKKEVYSAPVETQNAVVGEILARIGLDEGPMPEKLRFMTEDELKDLQSTGAEIGAHGATHVSLVGLASASARREIVDAKLYLESILGVPVKYISYPEGLYEQATIDAVRGAGYEGAFAVKPTVADTCYAIPRSIVSSDLGRINVRLSRPPRVGSGIGRMALLTSVPLSAPLYCEIVAKIREKFPDSVIVAKTSLSADEARTAYPHARVIPARANPVPSASPSPSDQSVLKVVERFLKRVGRSSLSP